MMKRFFNNLSVGLPLCLIMILIGCGKVAQDMGLKDENNNKKTFTLNYSVEVYTTQDIKIRSAKDKNIATQNIFTTQDSYIFSQIRPFTYEFKLDKDYLSWGNGILTINKKISDPKKEEENLKQVSQNGMNEKMSEELARSREPSSIGPPRRIPEPKPKEYLEYKSISKNSENSIISKSDINDVYLNYVSSKSPHVWNFKAQKVVAEFPLYLISVYSSDKNKVHLKLVEEAVVSGNKTVNLGTINLQDTFYSLLLLNYYKTLQHDQNINLNLVLEKLQKLYTDDIYQEINFAMPENQSNHFDQYNPVFDFTNKLLEDLLKIYLLMDQKEYTEAENFINSKSFSKISLKFNELLSTTIEKEKIKTEEK